MIRRRTEAIAVGPVAIVVGIKRLVSFWHPCHASKQTSVRGPLCCQKGAREVGLRDGVGAAHERTTR